MADETRTAKDVFTIDERVEMTQQALRNGLDGPRKRNTGRVVGFTRSPCMVRVIRDKHVTRETYHMNMWQRLEP